MYALVDCNNFYASCERLFRPDLHNKPIIVLSHNDGCVIARSNEAKQIKIHMGDPYFKIKALCKNHKVHVFSSNFPLYGDLSARIMSIIQEAWETVEIYSIDEAFLDLRALPADQHLLFCSNLQQSILKRTGIPTSIGLGLTKTLAKISNYLCKKELNKPVFNIQEAPYLLKRIPVGEVWGVGRQGQQALIAQGIHTAYDLATVNLNHYKQQWHVMLLRTAMELRGTVCFYHHKKPRQSILSSKSFSNMQTDFDVLAQALSQHCAQACEKLRDQSLTTEHLSIFIQTNRHRHDLPSYNPTFALKLIHPTDDIRVITSEAKRSLKKIFKPGFHYKKVGILLDHLKQKNAGSYQYDLLDNITEASLAQTEQLLSVLDRINQKFGRHTVKLAATGQGKPWITTPSILCSPCYTTRWSDLPVVKNLT